MKKDFKKIKTNGGAAILISIIFFLFISLAIISGLVSPSIREFRNAHTSFNSKKAYFLTESGSEDAIYRISRNMTIGDSETITLDSGSVTTTITTLSGNIKEVNSLGDVSNYQRKTKISLSVGEGASFSYGVQSGQGGFILENTSSITGNVYSAGSIIGSGNFIYGDAVSSGEAGLIDGIHTTGSAYAHTMQDSVVEKDAFYMVKTNTTVGGTSYPDSVDQPTLGLPISDDQVDTLKADALEGGVISSPCPYNINSDVTLGPVKINCDLNISGSPTVTLAGSVWVSGNVSIKNTAIVRVLAGLGGKSITIIADNPSNRTTSSSISLTNSVQFFGSGSSNSFVFLVSQNNSAELGGNEDAISMNNTSDGRSVILYANHGLININNSATLKEVTGYKIKAKNSANIVYDSGLANTLFTSGPGGGYEITGWKEE